MSTQGRGLRKPALQDEAFLADVAASPRGDGDFLLWWLGQSGFLLGWNGHFVLLDPYLSDSLTRKYEGSEKPHIRVMERVVDPTKLDFIDLTTSSHGHTDHQDPDTLLPLLKANPGMTVVIPASTYDVCGWAAEFRSRVHQIDADQSVTSGPFTITAIASAHERVEYDAQGSCRYLGYVIQFDCWTVYHSGDTVRYKGMVQRLRPFAVDVALLPINGRDPERGVAGNLDAREAVRLAADIGARLTIPCHFDMFAFNTADPIEFQEAADDCGIRYSVLQCGSRWDSGILRADCREQCERTWEPAESGPAMTRHKR